VYEWSDQPSHSRHMESGSRLSILWNCPWLVRDPENAVLWLFQRRCVSAMWCDGRPYCLNGGILEAALADDDLQKGTKVRDSVVGR
jgi:hypothetical protein